MGSRWLDTVGLANTEEFWRVIDSHAHVRAMVWGHVHQEYDGRRGDVRLFATPSTGAQFLPEERSLCSRFAPARIPAVSNCTPMARIDTEVHWVESLPMRQSAARSLVRATFGTGARLSGRSCSLLLCVTAARADGALHSLWELHGKHNTVYLLGSIHVLRASDYPLAPVGARRVRATQNRW